MSSEYAWTRTAVAKLIELYRNHECLWRTSCKSYKNRNIRERAISDIQNKLLELQPGIDGDKIKSKIQTIRNQHRRERNKEKHSMKSGSSTEEIYMPSLWCFHLLDFLDEIEEKQSSVSSLDNTEQSVSSAHASSTNEIQKPTEVLESAVERAKCSKKQKRSSEQIEKERALKKAMDVLNTPQDDESVFAEYVASEIRKLSDKNKQKARRSLAKLLIEISEDDDEDDERAAATSPMFIDDEETLRSSLSNFENPQEENVQEVEPDFQDPVQDSGPPAPTTGNSCSPVEKTYVTANPKRTAAWPMKRSNDKFDTVLDIIEQHFKKPKPKEDRYDVLGKNFALKIRDITDGMQRLLAEKMINDTLFMAETGQLTKAHSIRESAPTHSASPCIPTL